jgi:S-adenosylmethionine:tRNA ribosyltransferase-isomerase
MRVDLLDYDLPQERIAQHPTAERDGARMLIVEPKGAREVALSDARVADLAAHLPKRSLVVVNDTRVLPARLLARKPETGGKVEIFLVRAEGDESRADDGTHAQTWRALGKSSKPLRFDKDLLVSDDLALRILGRAEDDGLLRVTLSSKRSIADAIDAHGQVPLPPYIKRAAEDADAERYQTVFAKKTGAVAAPTAGLHLSNAVLGRLALEGHAVATVTLHVGLGTFQPVTVDDLDAHPMHEEVFEVGRATAQAIVAAKREGRPVIAVGTTTVRALEAAAIEARTQHATDPIVACAGTTRLLLQPGSPLSIVDGLLTNFHLPRSTLLALVAAFIGLDNLRAAYAHAVAHEYRFYSYGDAMLIPRAVAPDVVASTVPRA